MMMDECSHAERLKTNISFGEGGVRTPSLGGAERPAPPSGGPAVFAVPLGHALGQAQFFRLEIPAD